jgi:hypothetical protein
MKKPILLLACLTFCLLFISATRDNYEPVAGIEGVWELEHQFIYENDQISDTLYNLNGYRQVKMYSQGKVMWTRYNPEDSNEWFGYGQYSVKDGILEEQLEYASDAMMRIVDTVQVFRFELELGSDRYSQVSLDAEGNRYVSENYRRIE